MHCEETLSLPKQLEQLDSFCWVVRPLIYGSFRSRVSGTGDLMLSARLFTKSAGLSGRHRIVYKRLAELA